MNDRFSGLSETELESLSSVIAELNMLRANSSSEQSSIATEDALRYLRAAKYNSTRAIEIYKNYQKNRELYGLDEIRPYREPLNSEIASGKIQILGTSDDEDSPILLFTGNKHDSKYSKMDAAMQLLFHTLDQIANNDNAQNRGIVFLLDLRECSQDPKYLRHFISVLLNGYPLLLKMVYVVGAPMWVKPILMTFRHLNKIKFVTVPELSQHFSDHQLPITLGGKFHPHSDPPPQPISPGHTPPRPKLPRQQSHPEKLNDVVKPSGERAPDRTRLNPIVAPDQRARSHSGSAADRAHLRPLHPILPPSQKSSGRGKSPPSPATTTSELSPVDSKQGEGFVAALCQKKKLQKLRDMFQGKVEEDPSFTAPLKPPQVVTAGAATRKTTPLDSTHPSLENSGAAVSTVSNEQLLMQSQATPTVKIGGMGVASRIKNFEQVSTDSGGRGFGNRTKSIDNEGGGANRHGRGGRALVPVQIGSEGEREWERAKRSREEEGRRRREEEMRRRRADEDRQQKERRAREEPTKRSLEDDYENVDLGPPSSAKTTPSSKRAEVTPKGRKQQQGAESGRDNSVAYENVSLLFAGGKRSPDPTSKQNLGNFSHSGREQLKDSRAHNAAKVGVASSAGGHSPKKHQYENITILTESGPVPYHLDSSEDSDDFSGDEIQALALAPQEVIYENFGVDSGNQQMGADDIERHLAAKEKRGISAEYLRIKNEPLAHPHAACRLPCNIPKNRYKDVVCYDNSRVVLETLPGVEGSDYIHANYVSSYKKPKTFILTQGPTKKTLVDFWRLVWEQQVHVIVMTTKCVELGRHKCTQYWPEEGVIKYGNVTVTVSRLQQCEGYELRTMNISCAVSLPLLFLFFDTACDTNLVLC
jgi:hypothetical protein